MALIVLRHPPVVARGLCYGRHDPRPAPEAKAMIAEAVTEVMALENRPAALIASPSRRCHALAAALAEALGAGVQLDPRLQELDFGAWEGRPWAEIPRSESDPWAEDPVRRAPPGGETFAALSARVRDSLTGRGNALVVTHAGPIRALRILAGLATFETAFAQPVPHARPLVLPVPR